MYIVWLRDSICLVMRVRVCVSVCDAQLAETLCRQSYIYSSQSISKYVVSIHSTLSRSSRFYHQQYTHHNSCEYRLFWSMKTKYIKRIIPIDVDCFHCFFYVLNRLNCRSILRFFYSFTRNTIPLLQNAIVESK